MPHTTHPCQSPDGVAEIFGQLDVNDIVYSLLASLPPGVVAEKFLLRRMKELEAAAPGFARTPIADLPVVGGDGSFFLADRAAGMSLLELVHDGFLFPHAKAPHDGAGVAAPIVHRACLHDAHCRPAAIVSQSDVARFLSTHEAALGDLSRRTASDLGWVKGAGAIISVSPETSALAALALMKEKQIAGVAVVDGAGRLVGNFSGGSELRALSADRLPALALPVAEFLALEHGTEYWGVDHSHDGEAGPPPHPSADVDRARDHASGFARAAARRRSALGGAVGQEIAAAAPDDALATMLARLVSRRLHRLYIVDGDRKPVGVVTLTDVLRAVAKAAV